MGIHRGAILNRKDGYHLPCLSVGESKTFPLDGSGNRDVAHLAQNIRKSACQRKDMRFMIVSLPDGEWVRRLS